MKKSRKAKEFLEELSNVPVVVLVCEKTGLSRNTIYRWRKEDPEFRKEMDECLGMGEDSISDLAEYQCIIKIKAGYWPAIKHWLAHNRKKYITPKPKSYLMELFRNFKREKNVVELILEGAGIKPPDPQDQEAD